MLRRLNCQRVRTTLVLVAFLAARALAAFSHNHGPGGCCGETGCHTAPARVSASQTARTGCGHRHACCHHTHSSGRSAEPTSAASDESTDPPERTVHAPCVACRFLAQPVALVALAAAPLPSERVAARSALPIEAVAIDVRRPFLARGPPRA